MAEGTSMTSDEFTLEQAVQTFGLQYASSLTSNTTPHLWQIPETQSFNPPTTYLESFLPAYAEYFDRSSAAGRRPPLSLVLIECVSSILKDNSKIPIYSKPICCQLSFSHERCNPPINNQALAANIVKGRVDQGVGIVTRIWPRRRFHSLLLVVEAKSQNKVEEALPQLVVYLACLREGRQARGPSRRDCSVYGLVSDGLLFIFVTITHQGVLKLSRTFDISQGDLKTVLGCLKYILQNAVDMWMSTPEGDDGQKSRNDETDLGDDEIDLDDNEYLHPPEDSDEDDY